jgi:zinc transporter 1
MTQADLAESHPDQLMKNDPSYLLSEKPTLWSQFRSNQGKLKSMLFLTFSFFLVEIIVGHLSHSLTLISDAFHMLSDVLAMLIALYATIVR